MVRFDPRTKLLVLLGVSLLLLASHSLALELILFIFCEGITAASGRIGSAIRYAIVFAVMLVADLLIAPYLTGMVFAVFSFVVLVLRKFMPVWILGRWVLATTEVSEFVAAMRAMHLSQSTVIPLSVMFRYFPTIHEEWDSIRAAMRMRGIRISFEHIMVPLIFSAVSVADELSAAALCRGLDAPGEHTSYVKVGFGAADLVVIGLLVAYSISVLICKVQGVA